jgi:hypothetical protein
MGVSSGKLKNRSDVEERRTDSSPLGKRGTRSVRKTGVRSAMETARTMRPPRRRDEDKAAAILDGAMQEFMAYGSSKYGSDCHCGEGI